MGGGVQMSQADTFCWTTFSVWGEVVIAAGCTTTARGCNIGEKNKSIENKRWLQICWWEWDRVCRGALIPPTVTSCSTFHDCMLLCTVGYMFFHEGNIVLDRKLPLELQET